MDGPNAGLKVLKCPYCGGAEFVDGAAASMFPLHFRPQGVGKSSSWTAMKATQCRGCGNVQFFARVKAGPRVTA